MKDFKQETTLNPWQILMKKLLKRDYYYAIDYSEDGSKVIHSIGYKDRYGKSHVTSTFEIVRISPKK